MAHYYEVEDDKGDLIDLVVFCSDFCHQSYCRENGKEYGGWNGCHELEFTTPCESCGEQVHGLTATV
jgi:hypothetical protein